MRIAQQILQKWIYVSDLSCFCIQKENAIFSGLEKPPIANLGSHKGFLYLLALAPVVLGARLFAGQMGWARTCRNFTHHEFIL